MFSRARTRDAVIQFVAKFVVVLSQAPDKPAVRSIFSATSSTLLLKAKPETRKYPENFNGEEKSSVKSSIPIIRAPAVFFWNNKTLMHDTARSPDYLGDPANRSGGFCTSHAMDSKDVQEQNEDKICRICLEGELEDDELLAPCLCRGSSKYVHRGCLDSWRISGFDPKTVTHCGTCKAKFRLEEPSDAKGAEREVWTEIAVALYLFFILHLGALEATVAATWTQTRYWEVLLLFMACMGRVAGTMEVPGNHALSTVLEIRLACIPIVVEYLSLSSFDHDVSLVNYLTRFPGSRWPHMSPIPANTLYVLWYPLHSFLYGGRTVNFLRRHTDHSYRIHNPSATGQIPAYFFVREKATPELPAVASFFMLPVVGVSGGVPEAVAAERVFLGNFCFKLNTPHVYKHLSRHALELVSPKTALKRKTLGPIEPDIIVPHFLPGAQMGIVASTSAAKFNKNLHDEMFCVSLPVETIFEAAWYPFLDRISGMILIPVIGSTSINW
ncbi:ERAD-associated E3 ubiquitin-protein ligase doa10 [Symbiodinium microadriaticum]|uniref:ERAD-associated E3 ubiquitin-protein ligase doa10 n=1 Tax=Symbiodinium microadriaticum TaxID=2951 RepID=A0A1Q9DYD6_SYMMI|nr:ERAD-associated E3 ubiquitin-protein ligase doa10 [Symbiodinium microadriaticum]